MIRDIWRSLRRLPLWVQVWASLWLVPVNIAPIFFVGLEGAVAAQLVACFAIGGMAVNMPILMVQRGVGKTLALAHVVFLIPLVVIVIGLLQTPDLPESYRIMLMVLLVTDVISLGFDIKESWDWWRGDRGTA